MSNGNLPFFYDYANAMTSSRQPNTVHVTNTGLSRFFQRSLLQKAMSVFDITLPESWPLNYFLYVLFCNGYLAVIETDKFGIIPQQCTLGGYNVFYQPRTALISNPLISRTLQPVIDETCTLIRLQPDYHGIMDTVSYYGDMLALCAESMGINILNSKMSYLFIAETKAAAETAKSLYDNIASGRPAVVLDKTAFGQDGSLRWQMFEQSVKSNFIAPDLLEVMEALENRFCTEMGLPNVNTRKKERLVVDEVNANNFETQARVRLWLQELKRSFEKTNNMFGLNLSIKLREESVTLTPEKPAEKEADDV